MDTICKDVSDIIYKFQHNLYTADLVEEFTNGIKIKKCSWYGFGFNIDLDDSDYSRRRYYTSANIARKFHNIHIFNGKLTQRDKRIVHTIWEEMATNRLFMGERVLNYSYDSSW